jgi:hypothetical protein
LHEVDKFFCRGCASSWPIELLDYGALGQSQPELSGHEGQRVLKNVELARQRALACVLPGSAEVVAAQITDAKVGAARSCCGG